MVRECRKRLNPVVFIGLIGAYFAMYYAHPFSTGDAVWSNVIGQWILAHQSIPHQDYWTWTAFGQSWTPQEWGFEVLLASINHALGYLGIVAMMTVVSVLTWWLCLRTLQRLSVQAPYVLAVVAAVLSSAWDQLRAETFSYLFFAILVYIITLAREGRTRWLIALVPLEVIWANMHGSFTYGIAFTLWVGIAALFPSFRLHWIHHSRDKQFGVRLLITSVAMAGVALVNPQFWHVYSYSFWLSFNTDISKYIMEWQPSTITQTPAALIITEFVTLILLRIHQRQSVRLDTFVWVLGTFYLFLKVMRFGSYVDILLPIALAPVSSHSLTWLDRIYQRPSLKLKAVLKLGTAIGSLILTVQTVLYVRGDMIQNASQSVEPHVIPTLKTIYTKHPDWRIWNEYGVGDAIEQAGIPASIDGRTELYLTNGMMKEYMLIIQGKPGALKSLQSKHVRIVCVQKTQPITELLSENPNWTRIYDGELYTLYERKA